MSQQQLGSWLDVEPGARNLSVPLRLPQEGCVPASLLPALLDVLLTSL